MSEIVYINFQHQGEMHNDSTSAGMTFMNASLGTNHVLAHKLGLEFHIPH